MTKIELLRPHEEPVESDGLPVAASEEPFELEPAPEPASESKWAPSPVAGVHSASKGASTTARVTPRSTFDAMRAERASGNGAFRFVYHPSADTGESRLQRSLDALSNIVVSPAPVAGEWLDAAAILKRDAVRLRNSSQARHATVLLTLADALTFTAPSEPTLDMVASEVLQRGLALLTNPFISQEAEENLDIELISAGWNLAPASTGAPLAR